MRRLLLACLICLFLVTTVSAAGSVTQLENDTSVSSDGTCEVVITAQIRVDDAPDSLYFPLPAEAIDISLNGDAVYPALSGSVRKVDLKGEVPGTVVIRYSLPDAVVAESSGQLRLKLKLLCGFSYPIETATFRLTLPGEPENMPAFSSTYHQEAVDSMMDYTQEGNVITCVFDEGLKDHESLTMSLLVTEKMFPQPISKIWKLSTDDILMTVFALIALIYWGITMRCLPPRRVRRAKEPEGITAGQLGCCLTGQGIDLTMLVLSWGQMGYLQIRTDKRGRLLLEKRMEMGNERAGWEIHYFSALFGKSDAVDTAGLRYARLCRKAAAARPNIREYFRPGSGNPTIFRALCTAVGLFGGVSMASAMASDTVLRVLLSILLAALAAVASWQIQHAAAQIHLRHWRKLLWGIGYSLVWIILGALVQEQGVAVIVVCSQWMAGLMAGYGGRRSELGQQLLSQILGLRRSMTRLSEEERERILERNPEYFHQMLPYAMALGVDKGFARRFGDRELPGCTYLESEEERTRTAQEWSKLLRALADRMDARQRQLPWEDLRKRFTKK